MKPLRELERYGQSVWLDYIRRNLITSGELKKLIDDDGLKGITSNPAIFEKAIAGSGDYTEKLEILSRDKNAKAIRIYEQLAISDIQDAADILRPVFERTKRTDGYVSLEVSPYLAKDTKATLEEARRLWKEVNRENVMIKVPATEEGIPAIRQLISEGLNINVTLLFSMEYFEKVALAYFAGLEDRIAAGKPIENIFSVASFFISRIDSLVDNLLTQKAKNASPEHRGVTEHLLGKVAIANAKLTYQHSKKLYSSPQWQAIAAKGGNMQRLLWASTSTKNPRYADVMYVEELIGADTVNTMPPATLDAFRDHGRVQAKIEQNLDEAHDVMRSLAQEGINFDEVCHQLTEEGVKIFADSFDKLLNVVEEKRQQYSGLQQTDQSFSFDLRTKLRDLNSKEKLSIQILKEMDAWENNHKTHRLWARDASLWTNKDESNWMGWLSVTESARGEAKNLEDFSNEIRNEGFKHILLLGMGGSSLCPQVLQKTFSDIKGYPQLRVLDSTDPAQIAEFEKGIDFTKALCVVSSKSGGTLEPNIFKQYFFEKVKKIVGEKNVGAHFVAITDPNTKLEKIAHDENFRRVFHGISSIGGRYSALSNFGLVPAALMGVDVGRLLDSAEEMLHACAPSVSAYDNPGVSLGVILGSLALQRKDKVTLLTSPKIKELGAWLEQLIAESTGKIGKGLIPIDRELKDQISNYSSDRIFAYIRLEGDDNASLDQLAKQLDDAGHPVVVLSCRDAYGLGGEFFRWEIATATAGAIIGINPFDQPDVEASKIETHKLTDAYESTGTISSLDWFASEGNFSFFAHERDLAELKSSAANLSAVSILKAHLSRIVAGDYFNVSAFVQMNESNDKMLQEIRSVVMAKKKVATCHGFGPRFLHSTGQAYKGGPSTGVFLQLTCDDARDLPIPGQKFSFGVVKETQARGDMAVLAQRGRRVLRVHIKGELSTGLSLLKAQIEKALS